MNNRRKSVIWKIPKNNFLKLISESNSISEAIRKLGMDCRTGGAYKTIKKRIDEENIDTSHIGTIKTSPYGKSSIPLEKVLVKNSSYSRNSLKKRLLKERLLENKCGVCGMEPTWQGNKLVLVLDHINGINNDNRLENLRLLCPNCNSQTDTFAGRNGKIINNCVDCGKEIANQSMRCRPCAATVSNYRNRKVKNRPNKESLLLDISNLGYTGTGRKYNVSDNAIRK